MLFAHSDGARAPAERAAARPARGARRRDRPRDGEGPQLTPALGDRSDGRGGAGAPARGGRGRGRGDDRGDPSTPATGRPGGGRSGCDRAGGNHRRGGPGRGGHARGGHARVRGRAARASLRRLALAGAAVLLVLAVVAGVLAGRSGSEASGTRRSASRRRRGASVLSFPAGVDAPVDGARGSPACTFSDPLALAPSGGKDGQLVAGSVNATGPTLLPAALLARLDPSPKANDPVRLGSLQAYRYKDLRPKGVNGTPDGCSRPPRRTASRRWRASPRRARRARSRPTASSVAGTLRLAGAKPYSLGPSDAYAAALGKTISRLDTRERARGAPPEERGHALSAGQRGARIWPPPTATPPGRCRGSR